MMSQCEAESHAGPVVVFSLISKMGDIQPRDKEKLFVTESEAVIIYSSHSFHRIESPIQSFTTLEVPETL